MYSVTMTSGHTYLVEAENALQAMREAELVALRVHGVYDDSLDAVKV